MRVEKAAKGLIRNDEVSEGLLNKIEMALRAYDSCHACPAHSLLGHRPLLVTYDSKRGVSKFHKARPIARERPLEALLLALNQSGKE